MRLGRAGKVLPLSEARARLSAIVHGLERNGKPVTITRNGKVVAVMLSKRKYDGLRETLEILSDAAFSEQIRHGIRALRRTKKRMSIDELFADERKK